MFNCDYISEENIKKHNPKWPEIPDHPYWILIIGGSGSVKNKCIVKSNKWWTDIDENLFTCWRSVRSKMSITN